MPNPYARWIDRQENRLASRDNDRVVRPFEWGLEWLGLDTAAPDPARAISEAARGWLADSEAFFGYAPVGDYTFEAGDVTFTSPLASPFPENNRVRAAYFPTVGAAGRAVLVLPQWNADEQGHIGLCKLLNRFNIAALRMTLPYHGPRMPPGQTRADYHVSSNVGRTIHACRQAVVDARACLDWLERQGYSRLGILGTSLGSCIAFIAAAHDARVRLAVYNHASTYFADAVWTGLATRHVRQGLDGSIALDELRHLWKIISPFTFLDRMRGRDIRSLIVWGRYDTTFLPCYTREMIDALRACGPPLETRALPCGHYTTGQFPFNLMDGFAMCLFVRRSL